MPAPAADAGWPAAPSLPSPSFALISAVAEAVTTGIHYLTPHSRGTPPTDLAGHIMEGGRKGDQDGPDPRNLTPPSERVESSQMCRNVK